MRRLIMVLMLTIGLFLGAATGFAATGADQAKDPLKSACETTIPSGAVPPTAICTNSAEQAVKQRGSTGILGSDGFVVNLVGLVIRLTAIVAVIVVIIGGFKYATAGGDSSSLASAKNAIIYGLVGLVISAFAQIIVRWVVSRLY